MENKPLICTDCRLPFTLNDGKQPFTRMLRGSGPVCPLCQKHAGIGVGTQYPGIGIGKGNMRKAGGQKGISRQRMPKTGYYNSSEPIIYRVHLPKSHGMGIA